MADMHWVLLDEDLLTVRLDQRAVNASLPDALSLLVAHDEVGFAALQAHQEHAWHAFLCQLAAMAMHEMGATELPREAARWREALLALTGGDAAPWALVVQDLSRPAFLQPPIPGATLSDLKAREQTPDELDLLVTAKNHDVKMARADRASAELWAYSLVSLQTMEGFGGAGNYGIARMNGGYSSRPCVAMAPSMASGTRFRRDAMVLLRARARIAGQVGYPLEGGHRLLWTVPWDGSSSIPLAACDPLFIELCRILRLVTEDGRVVARRKTTTVPRVAAAAVHGRTGDAWTPVHFESGKALTIPAAGFTFQRAQELLLGGTYAGGAALDFCPDDGPAPVFVADVLVRGQGRTDGLHRRVIPIPRRASLLLRSAGGRQRVAQRATERVADTDEARRKILHHSLRALLQGGRQRLDFRDKRPARWLTSFDAAVDREFFAALWRDIEVEDLLARRAWREQLVALARGTLDDAIAAAPMSAAGKYRAVAAAERIFGATRRRFMEALQTAATKENGHD